MTISKVLLVDDSITMHRAVALSLKKENVELICCDNGQDGLRLAQEHRPSIVLADLDMPGLTGIELCQAIKKDASLKDHARVILLCGSFDQVDESHLDRVPADGRLWKPFESHVLVSLVRKLLSENPRQSNERTAPLSSPTISSASEATGDIPLPVDEPSYGDVARDMTQETFSGLSEPEVPLYTPTDPTAPFLPTAPAATSTDESQDALWGATTAPQKTGPLAQTMETLRKELTAPPRSMVPPPPMPSHRSMPGADVAQFRTQEKTQPIPTIKKPSPTEIGRASEATRPLDLAPSATVSEDRIREIVREEIERAMGAGLRQKLQDELHQVIAEIDRS